TAGAQAEIVASDLPAPAQLFRDELGAKPVADELAETLLDRVWLRGDPGQRELGREHASEAAHAAGHVQRGRSRYGVGVARRQDQDRANAEREAHLLASQLAQSSPG